jgi:hypothetical protein
LKPEPQTKTIGRPVTPRWKIDEENDSSYLEPKLIALHNGTEMKVVVSVTIKKDAAKNSAPTSSYTPSKKPRRLGIKGKKSPTKKTVMKRQMSNKSTPQVSTIIHSYQLLILTRFIVHCFCTYSNIPSQRPRQCPAVQLLLVGSKMMKKK